MRPTNLQAQMFASDPTFSRLTPRTVSTAFCMIDFFSQAVQR